ncbi:MAG: DUF2493 domain-containing protein [Clostridiales bacterium]|nr:DUF2493 domain-containing protein [Clostridiales bacterium]
MKVAIVGSRNIIVDNLQNYLPENTTEIVSGGAKGVDSCARDYAIEKNILITEFLPDYKRYGRGAPLRRNQQIVDYADEIILFWEGQSKGSKFVIDYCKKKDKKVTVYHF